MLWIAVYLPALSLQAFAATLGSARLALPLALLDGQRVCSVNHVALQLGVQPGLKRATALALAPQLVLGHADAAREDQALQAVAHAALAFTPSVAIESMQRFRSPAGLAVEPDAAPCVLLEVQASLRYFGGLAALLRKLRAALAPLGFSHRLASAPTAAGAALLARWRDGLNLGPHSTQLPALHGLLDQAPVELLGTAREQLAVLQGMGVHKLADLRRLPRAGLARRFGAALLLQMDRARGEQANPQHWFSASERFEAGLELFERTDSIEQVLHAAAVLLARLIAWAQARHARILAFTLAMQHEARHRADAPACTMLQVNLAEASNDAAHLQLLLRERLAHVSLPAPTLQLQLRCEQVVHRAAPNAELFPTPASADEGLLRLIERLRSRLGDEQVQRLVPVEDHRPERTTSWQPAWPAPASPRPGGAAALPVRPVWLLAQALPLRERESCPLLDGRALHLLAGPERIEAGWWDGETAARDYFIAQAHDAALVWIYRARLPDSPAGEGWFLHGRFG